MIGAMVIACLFDYLIVMKDLKRLFLFMRYIMDGKY